MKKLKSFVGIIIMCLFVLNIEATIVPRWNNTSTVTIKNAYESGQASLSITIYGLSDVDKIDNVDIDLYHVTSLGTITLIAYWDDLSANSFVFRFSDKVSNVYQGHTYRLEYTADVHRNGSVETVSGYKESVY